MSTLVPLLEILVLGIPLLTLLTRTLPLSERRRVLTILLSAFALRLATATLFDVFPSTRVFHEDASGYEIVGMRLAAQWLGTGPPLQMEGLSSGFFFFCGVLYSIFGQFRLVATAFLSLCGTLSVFMVYRITARVFHKTVATRAAMLTAFFPSMILWSAMALKDPLMILLITVVLDCILSLRDSVKVPALVLLVGAIVGIWIIRFYVLYALVFAAFISVLLARSRGFVGNLSRQFLVVAVVAGVFLALGLGNSVMNVGDNFDLERINSYRHGMAITANSGFAADTDISTPSRVLAFLPVGMSVLFLGPFPWQMVSLRPLLTLPEMLLWWSMVPSVIRGLKFGISRERQRLAPIIGFAVALASLYALTLGNVGAAFRQRAQIFVFLFIFAALGQYVSLCRNRGISDEYLRVKDW